MIERGIIFSAPMVCALLADQKSQTRRLAGRWKYYGEKGKMPALFFPTLWTKVKPGDRLWVRENFAYVGGGDPGLLLYEATWREDAERHGCDKPFPPAPKWTSSMFMPRQISRITLVVAATRVERVRDISEDDALAEGVPNDHSCKWPDGDPGNIHTVRRRNYARLWCELHGRKSWKANPEVVVLTFAVEKKQLARAA